MKRYLLLLYIAYIAISQIINHSVYSQSTWYWQQPLPTGNFLYSVDFVNPQTGYAVGTIGTIMKTTDGGGSWNLLNSGLNFLLINTSFYDENLGFVVGGDFTNYGNILRTSNGGLNWVQILTTDLFSTWAIEFPTRNTGYLAGSNGVILKSTNAGLSWIQQNTGTGASLLSLSFMDSINGVAGGNRKVIKTTDGGLNWINQNINFVNFLAQVTSINYVDTNTIICLAQGDNRIYKTINNGIKWNGYLIGLPDDDIPRTISFIDENTGLMATDYGRILRSTNGGINWTTDSTFKPPYHQIGVLRFVEFLNSDAAYVSGSGGRILKSTNGGINWLTTTGNGINLESNYFTSENTGYSAGYNGVILKTSNAGQSWNPQTTNTTQNLHDVYFVNADVGYVCGDTGTILKTTNGGENWSELSTGIITNLYGIFFTDVNTGTSVGANGKIIRTTDAGNNWNLQTSGTTFDLLSVFFVESVGFSCSESGILKTYNGGTNWFTTLSGAGLDIYFTDSLVGYSLGAAGIIGKTTNGGHNWIIQNGSVSGNLLSIFFINENNGIAVGGRGDITKTTNGGTNWIAQPLMTANILTSVFMVNANTGYITGEFGTILKTTNAGLTFISKNTEVIPEDFQLYQNYPNPFNPTTMIEYSLKKNAYVEVKLFDIKGKEITKLVNEYQTEGNYKILFDASTNNLKLSTGVYFYSLSINDQFINTKKLILIK